ncbi:MAG: hypothetical protein DHS20C14_19890 [Phycisphaeraceae bacterium]|nr:MAG: hypothetical protein DHS20C14_19890 [Phycisphaeraceae bacterium]
MTRANPRKFVVFTVAGAGIGLGAFMAVRFVRASGGLAGELETRTLVDAETGDVLADIRLPTGATYPFEHPKTGRATLYPAERCHWTADGDATLTPTYVLLNAYTGTDGPTMCPDCGRVVVAHNPLPPDELMIEAAEREGG